jgi:hypothetical protein
MKPGKFLKAAARIGAPGLAYGLAAGFLLDHTRMSEEVKGLIATGGGLALGAALSDRDPSSALGVAIGGGIVGGIGVARGLRFRAYLAQLATPSQRAAQQNANQTPGQLNAPANSNSTTSSNTTTASAGIRR